MKETKEEKELALGKQNLILLAVGFIIVITGFVLMMGSSNGVEYNPDIYSFRRTAIAPVTSFLGFMFIIVAILWKPKENTKEK